MPEVKWIKITTTMFEDEKIDFIESLPEADTILIIWVKLLTLAGKCNAGGYIFLTENIPYTEEMLAHKFRRPLSTVKLALETFQRLGMVQINEHSIYITNWEKHQNVEKLEAIREYNRLAKQKQRQKQKLLSQGQCQGHVHGSQDLDLDIDKDKEISIIQREMLHLLKSIENWPFDYTKDLEHIRTLEVDFPQLDLLNEVQRFKTYKLDKPLKKGSNARLQLRNWCAKAVEFGRVKKEQKIDAVALTEEYLKRYE